MSKTISSLKKTIEYLWLTVAIIAFAIGTKELITHNFRNALPFFIFSLIGLFFGISRRTQRMRSEKDK